MLESENDDERPHIIRRSLMFCNNNNNVFSSHRFALQLEKIHLWLFRHHMLGGGDCFWVCAQCDVTKGAGIRSRSSVLTLHPSEDRRVCRTCRRSNQVSSFRDPFLFGLTPRFVLLGSRLLRVGLNLTLQFGVKPLVALRNPRLPLALLAGQ